MHTKSVSQNMFSFIGKCKLLAGKITVFLLPTGLSYVVFFPILCKLSSALMSPSDLYDTTVALIPKSFYLGNFKYVIQLDNFMVGFLNTFFYATIVSVCTVISSTVVGYGFARFNFRGKNLCFLLLLITLLVPGLTVSVPLYTKFRFFDIFGLTQIISGKALNLTGTAFPLILLSLSCLGFRGGIYPILMRQYFKGVPDEIAEAAYVDGAGYFKTFLTIMLPMARSIMVVVFILAFSWQWSDTYYLDTLFSGENLLPNVVLLLTDISVTNSEYFMSIVYANSAAILVMIVPLVLFVVFQRKIIEGIERAGLVG